MYDSDGEESSSSSIVTGGAQTPPSGTNTLSCRGIKTSPLHIKSESCASLPANNHSAKSPSSSILLPSSPFIHPPPALNHPQPTSTSSMVGNHQHHNHFLYHPSQHSSEWYHTPGTTVPANESLNHFSHHHHHHHPHLVHPGAATAY